MWRGENNMKIYTILFLLLLVISIPSTALAGDYAELNYIGVSENGKYMAFEEYGVQDGSGFAYSNVYFVEVETNKYAAKPVRILVKDEQASLENIRKKSKKSAAKNLKKFGIVKGNMGKVVVSRLMTDSAFVINPYKDGSKTQNIKFRSHVGSLYGIGDYELILNPIKVEDKKDYVDNPVYKLDLSFRDLNKNTQVTLQKDKALPKTRGLPVAYRTEKIYLYGEDKIIVFLNVFTSGFEGPDMRYMVVTGKYK